MVRVTLLVHFFCGEEFLGQKLQWVEVPNTGTLGTLIDLLAQGRNPDNFHVRGTEEYPTESGVYQKIRQELGLVFDNPYRVDEFDKKPDWKHATSVRVVQVIEGWPLQVPRVLSFC